MNNCQEVGEITLFLTAALAGEPTENIRAVAVSERGNVIELRFILYRRPTADEIENIGYIGTEFISNYSSKFGDEHYEVIPHGEISLGEGEFVAYGKD